ncbi:MAG: response regulator [Bacteroidota bacterium]
MSGNQILRIVILEDNLFYNKLFSRKIEQLVEKHKVGKNITFVLDSFNNYSEFLNNFNKDTNIAFVDFNLDNNFSGIDVIKDIRNVSFDCTVIIISDAKNNYNLYHCLYEGASGIVLKNDTTFDLCSYLIEEQIKRLAT